MDMKEKLIRICEELSIEHVGIAPVGPYMDLERLLRLREEKGELTGFEHKDIKKRVDPRETLADARSVIVCLFPYFYGHTHGSNISKYAHGIDYHIIIKEKLDRIGIEMSNLIDNFRYMSFADTGPLVDRYLAYLAGLGFWGWNQHIINQEYGSYVLIGYIINNYPFEPDKPLNNECLRCGACVRNCPGNALDEGYGMKPARCLSYITQKKDLTEEDALKIKKNKMVFGCDICQDSCPHNRKAKVTSMVEFKKDLINYLKESDIIDLSKNAFKKKYGNRAFGWRGKKLLLRNLNHLK